MAKPRTLRTLLWRAANEHLPHEVPFGSCSACWCAAGREWEGMFDDKVIPFLSELAGLQSDKFNSERDRFREFAEGHTKQGARYLWLDFARLVAEDERL